MNMSNRLFVATLALISSTTAANAGFFGTFDPIPEPSTLSVVAIGAGFVAVRAFLKSRNRDR